MGNDIQQSTQLCNTEDTAAHLALQAATLAQMRWRGDRSLPWVKLGKAVRYKLSDIEAYIEKNTVSEEVSS
jgi:predicted DNA-binding transcriptional regulator AlpA